VLHLKGDKQAIAKAYQIYNAELSKLITAPPISKHGPKQSSFTLANRLFGHTNYTFDRLFLQTCKSRFKAPLEQLNFAESDASRQHINQWVEKQTKEKIKELLPEGSINSRTRLVLTNALHFKASWNQPFSKHITKPLPFYQSEGKPVKASMMQQTSHIGYHKEKNYQAVTLPYGWNSATQFLVILPNEGTSLNEITSNLTAEELKKLSQLKNQRVRVSLPKFKLASGSISLADALKSLGMKQAFSRPLADFSAMEPRKELYIGAAFHKTFIAVDEEGTEAAAATAVVMEARGMPVPQPEPITFNANRPFFFAIQDKKSGNCLFMGKLTNPLQ